MTRINTNVSSLVAQNRLQSSNKDLNSALTRLSTGLRINSGADDPAGLIASEALRSEVTSLSKSISNTNRASQIISTADSALSEVSNLLNDVRGLVVEASNSGALSKEEIAANQLQIDSSLEAINRISQSTTFQGRKLLDGSLDFTNNASSVDSIKDINIDQANLGATGSVNVEVVVAEAAEQAEVTIGAAAFTDAANASAEVGEFGQVADQALVGTAGANIIGQGLKSIEFVNNANATNAGEASFDADTGVLTITGDFEGGAGTDATSAAIIAAVDGLDGFTAAAATATDPGANTTPTGGTVSDIGGGITVNATVEGADFNNVAVEFVNSGAAGSTASANFDTDQKVLTVTLASDATAIDSTDLETAIEAATVDGSTPASAAFSVDATANAEFNVNQSLDVTGDTGVTGGEVLKGDLVFQLNGATGAETFNFGGGTSIDQIAAAINLVSDATGVQAKTEDGLAFNSTEYGTDAVVGVEVINEGTGGTFESSLSSIRATGKDISATVNGIEAGGSGNQLSINTSTLDLSLTVEDGSDTNFSFNITGGGARFQLGPDVVSTQQASIGIGSVSTGQLGGASGRLYELGSGQSKSLANDVTGAAEVVDEVIEKVTSLRGRLGAFQSTTLDSNLTSLNETRANLSEAQSSIRDADFAEESAKLTRAQILVQSGTNVLSLANQSPQNVLSLIR